MKTAISTISDRIVLTRTDKDHVKVEYFCGDYKRSDGGPPAYWAVGGTLTLIDLIIIPAIYRGPKEGDDFPGSCPADWA